MRLFLAAALTCAALPALAQQGYEWTYNRYVEASPLETILTLAYGVPQTDDLQAFAICAIGANWIYADVRLALDIDGLEDGAMVDLAIGGDGYQAIHSAQVERQEEGIWGVVFALGLDDPIWSTLGGAQLTYGIPGRPAVTMALQGLAPLAQEFQRDCARIIDLTPDQAPSK